MQFFYRVAIKGSTSMQRGMSLIEIREVELRDETVWRELWAGYCDFYGVRISPAVTEATWRRLVSPLSTFVGRVARLDGEIVGLSVSIIHECSWTIASVCYLEDLFVAPAMRGRGVGRALIEDLVGLARESGWARVYWHTRADNVVARRLYDRFGEADGFVRYRLLLD